MQKYFGFMTYNNCINYFSIIFMRIEYKIITIDMKLRDYKELAYFEKNSSFFKKLKIIKRFQYQKKNHKNRYTNGLINDNIHSHIH